MKSVGRKGTKHQTSAAADADGTKTKRETGHLLDSSEESDSKHDSSRKDTGKSSYVDSIESHSVTDVKELSDDPIPDPDVPVFEIKPSSRRAKRSLPHRFCDFELDLTPKGKSQSKSDSPLNNVNKSYKKATKSRKPGQLSDSISKKAKKDFSEELGNDLHESVQPSVKDDKITERLPGDEHKEVLPNDCKNSEVSLSDAASTSECRIQTATNIDPSESAEVQSKEPIPTIFSAEISDPSKSNSVLKSGDEETSGETGIVPTEQIGIKTKKGMNKPKKKSEDSKTKTKQNVSKNKNKENAKSMKKLTVENIADAISISQEPKQSEQMEVLESSAAEVPADNVDNQGISVCIDAAAVNNDPVSTDNTLSGTILHFEDNSKVDAATDLIELSGNVAPSLQNLLTHIMTADTSHHNVTGDDSVAAAGSQDGGTAKNSVESSMLTIDVNEETVDSDVKPKKIYKRKPKQCEVCGKTVKDLAKHMLYHDGGPKIPLPCPYCDYKTVYKENLFRHKQVKHSTERPEKCPSCDQAFVNKLKLRKHIHMEHGDGRVKRHQCSQCPFITNSIYVLRRHISNIHEVRDKYECPYCNLKLRYKDTFAVHLRRHTGERPYVCKDCGSAFNSSSCLNQHMKTHQEKQFECVVCHKRFTTRHHMERHCISVHQSGKPFHCPFCSYACNNKYNLRKHCKMQHGKIYPPMSDVEWRSKMAARRQTERDPPIEFHMIPENENASLTQTSGSGAVQMVVRIGDQDVVLETVEGEDSGVTLVADDMKAEEAGAAEIVSQMLEIPPQDITPSTSTTDQTTIDLENAEVIKQESFDVSDSVWESLQAAVAGGGSAPSGQIPSQLEQLLKDNNVYIQVSNEGETSKQHTADSEEVTYFVIEPNSESAAKH